MNPSVGLGALYADQNRKIKDPTIVMTVSLVLGITSRLFITPPLFKIHNTNGA